MAESESNNLFSKDAIVFQRNKAFGSVTIIQPLPVIALTALIAIIFLIACSFLYFGEYARKVTVQGFIEPDVGLVRIYPNLQGATVGAIFVEEGEQVGAGDQLAILDSSLTSREGEASIDVQLAEFNHQLELLNKLTDNVKIRSQSNMDQYQIQLRETQKEIDEQIALRNLQEERVEISIKQVAAARSLYDSNLLSESQWLTTVADRIEHEKVLALARQRQIQLYTELANLQQIASQHDSSTEDELAQLSFQDSQIRQAIIDLEIENERRVYAPESGTVTGIQARRGEMAIPGKPLLSLLPKDSKLVGKLLIPSSAIGFVSPGLKVRLMLDSFPHQQFGTIAAELISISHAAVAPGDLDSPIQTQVPVYLAEVSVEAEAFEAYGEQHFLRAGMLVKAEIILERRSLFDWLVEPLYSLRGRAS